MLTPVDVQNKVFKGGIGFDKKDVEFFMEELTSDYSELYRSNVELKDKVATLDESLQHYRSIEESVQKSLTISEKAAEETINAAQDKARQIGIEAEKKAEALLADAKEELERIQGEIFRLQNQHRQFVEQYKKILNAQLQLCDGEVIDIDLGDGFDADMYSSGSYGGLGSEGGLGGGGYTGSSSFDDGRERAAGEPATNIGSLNLDPFADAKNGGGRFSSMTTQKTSSSKSGDTGKISLNIKSEQPASVKVKRNIPASAASVKSESDNVNQATQNKKDSNKKASSKKSDNAPNKELKSQKAKEEKLNQMKEQQRILQEEAIKEAQKAEELAKIKAEEERKAAEEAAALAKQKAEEDARNEEMAQAHFDSELESTINVIREAAKKQNEPKVNPYVSQTVVLKPKAEAAVDEEDTVVGEVEDKVDESTMIDSEDNYSTGFDFVSDDSDSAMNEGVDSLTFEDEDSAFEGEVEDKVNESNMIDSEDNHDDGFDFLVEEEPSEEIPVINQEFQTNFNFSIHSDEVASSKEESGVTEGLNANINFGSQSDDVFEGDVEEKINQSTLIGNDDDDDDGFNFL